MKLISWNVNGLRACLNKGFLDTFRDLDADIFCLQETKLQAGQLDLELEGYHQYWSYAQKKGYSGTAVFCRQTPLSVRYGMDKEEHDTEGRLITLEFEDFYLVCCYTPNAQQELKRIDYRMQWEDDLLNYLQALDKEKPVVYCGDLNVAHQEIDLKNPKTNRGNAGYSWWSYRFHAREKNAGWRIDYFIVSNRMAPQITGADIHSTIMGSDHCPVELDLDL